MNSRAHDHHHCSDNHHRQDNLPPFPVFARGSVVWRNLYAYLFGGRFLTWRWHNQGLATRWTFQGQSSHVKIGGQMLVAMRA